jgi:SAM-dependent methyltransferase
MPVDRVDVACVVCTGTSTQTFAEIDTYRIAQCTKCSFLFVDPRPTPQALDRLYASRDDNPYYAEGYEPLERELPTLVDVVGFIKSYVPRGKLLELGCGRGDFLGVAQERGFEVEGCDIGAEADEKFLIHHGALHTLPLAKSTYDVVVTRNTLEHLFDPTAEVRAVHELLKPGGLLYIKVPGADFEHGWRRRMMSRTPLGFAPPWHLNYFNKATLTRFLNRLGFEVVAWRMEIPTPTASWRGNLVRRAGFLLIETLRRLTFGHFFPQPLLVCMARKKAVLHP